MLYRHFFLQVFFLIVFFNVGAQEYQMESSNLLDVDFKANINRVYPLTNGNLLTLEWAPDTNIKLFDENGKLIRKISPSEALIDSLELVFTEKYHPDMIESVKGLFERPSFESVFEYEGRLLLLWYISIYSKQNEGYTTDYIPVLSKLDSSLHFQSHEILHLEDPGFPLWEFWDKLELRAGNFIANDKLHLIRNLSEIKENTPLYRIVDLKNNTVKFSSNYIYNRDVLAKYFNENMINDLFSQAEDESTRYSLKVESIDKEMILFSKNSRTFVTFPDGKKRFNLKIPEKRFVKKEISYNEDHLRFITFFYENKVWNYEFNVFNIKSESLHQKKFIGAGLYLKIKNEKFHLIEKKDKQYYWNQYIFK